MRDETAIILSVVAAATVIGVALIMRDKGTYIVRDARGNVTAILPNNGPYYDAQSSPAKTAVGKELDELSFSKTYMEANR